MYVYACLQVCMYIVNPCNCVTSDRLQIIIICKMFSFTVGVEVGFNQSEVVVSEGTSAVALLCAEITSGTLDREITVYLEADNSTTPSGGEI